MKYYNSEKNLEDIEKNNVLYLYSNYVKVQLCTWNNQIQRKVNRKNYLITATASEIVFSRASLPYSST